MVKFHQVDIQISKTPFGGRPGCFMTFAPYSYYAKIFRTFPGLSYFFTHLNDCLFTMATTDYNIQLDLALTDLAQQDQPNFLGRPFSPK